MLLIIHRAKVMELKVNVRILLLILDATGNDSGLLHKQVTCF